MYGSVGKRVVLCDSDDR